MTLNEQLKALCKLIEDNATRADIFAAVKAFYEACEPILISGGELPHNLFDGLSPHARLAVANGMVTGMGVVFGNSVERTDCEGP